MRPIIVFAMFISFHLFVLPSSQAQGLVNGECCKVITNLRNYYNNDSVAIEYFKLHYQLDNKEIQKKILNRNSDWIIRFFQMSEHAKLSCYIKGWYNQKDLIIK